jgi:hypothetical protein
MVNSNPSGVSKWETRESNEYTAGGGAGLNASGIDKK